MKARLKKIGILMVISTRTQRTHSAQNHHAHATKQKLAQARARVRVVTVQKEDVCVIVEASGAVTLLTVLGITAEVAGRIIHTAFPKPGREKLCYERRTALRDQRSEPHA